MADKEDGMADAEDGMADEDDNNNDSYNDSNNNSNNDNNNDNNKDNNDNNNDSDNVKRDFPDMLCISKGGDERKGAVRFVGGGVDKRTVQCWLEEEKCSLKILSNMSG